MTKEIKTFEERKQSLLELGKKSIIILKSQLTKQMKIQMMMKMMDLLI